MADARKAKQERMRAVPRFVRLITWQRLERGGDLPHAYAVQRTESNVDAIAKAQSDGLVADR